MSLKHGIYKYGTKDEYRVYQANKEMVSLGLGHKLGKWYYCEVGLEAWVSGVLLIAFDSEIEVHDFLFEQVNKDKTKTDKVRLEKLACFGSMFKTTYESWLENKPKVKTKKQMTKLTDLPVVNLPKRKTA